MALDARTGEMAAGVALALAGTALAAGAAGMPGGSLALPGPGFVPLAVGVLLALVGAGCAASARGQRPGVGTVALGGPRVWGTLGTLALTALAFEPLGAPLTLAAALAALFGLLGRASPARSLVLGAAASGAAWLVFTKLLGVGLPAGPLPL